MPIYIFKNPRTGETKEVRQRMTEKHTYVDEDNLEWTRVFIPLNFSIDTQPDIFSSESFAETTSNKKENIGDLMDRAKEAAEKRKDKLGYDPVQKKWFENYSKQRKGKRHPNDPAQ